MKQNLTPVYYFGMDAKKQELSYVVHKLELENGKLPGFAEKNLHEMIYKHSFFPYFRTAVTEDYCLIDKLIRPSEPEKVEILHHMLFYDLFMKRMPIIKNLESLWQLYWQAEEGCIMMIELQGLIE